MAVASLGGSAPVDKIVTSTDGGQTWFNIGPAYTTTYNAIATDGNTNWVVVGNVGTSSYNVLYSTNNGVTWTPATGTGIHGALDTFFSAAYGNGKFVIGGNSPTGPICAISSDGGATWTAGTTPPGGDGVFNALAYRAPIGGQTAGEWVAGMGARTTADDKIYRSVDDGNTWQAQSLPIDTAGSSEYFDVKFAHVYNNIFFLGGELIQGGSPQCPMLMKFSEFGRYSFVHNPYGSDLYDYRDMIPLRGGYMMIGSSNTVSNYNYILHSANLI
jgi:hypothetical protein